jgi:hypothetical protein
VLKNNLTLELFDASRQITQDRWLVVLVAKIEVPVEPSIAAIDEVDWKNLKSVLGSSVLFEQKRERNFVANEAKDNVFLSLRDNFKDTLMDYLAHPEFAKRFILGRYNERRYNPRHACS